uniref:Odorant-binding protein 47a, isoform B n=1 Tax=Drosophila melanogaster TaxID=7227 RepID=A1Z8E4_DROME|nr:Odorant-binding protein 47a, isoform B [Drosophila melanogaster]AAS64866.1 Odorant-binding protein 47a, isoform B [Drosophila melanogaster]|eukprot:NP_995810.1 Odorant-binding protein 47a, isoform B [Drosophila melanogaster]
MNRVLVLLLVLKMFALSEININLGLTVADESPKTITEEMIRLCGDQTDISLRELNKLQREDFSDPSESVQCFTHCLYEQMGLMHDGVFVERDLFGLLSDVSNTDYWPERQCHAIRGNNKCETAYRIHQCQQQLKQQQQNLLATKEVEVTTTPAGSDETKP